MDQQSHLERAKQGDRQAITTVLNYLLKDRKVVAKVGRKDNVLLVFLEADRTPDENVTVNLLQTALENLELSSITSVRIYGKSKKEDSATWVREVRINNSSQLKKDIKSNNLSTIETSAIQSSQSSQNAKKNNSIIELLQLTTKFILYVVILLVLVWLIVAAGFSNEILEFAKNVLVEMFSFLISIIFAIIHRIFNLILFLVCSALILFFLFCLIRASISSASSDSSTTQTPHFRETRSQPSRRSEPFTFRFDIPSDKVWVEPHRRKDGTVVKGHWRKKPK